MLRVGFHHVRTLLHLCQGDGHVLLLHTAAGRKTEGKGRSPVTFLNTPYILRTE